ncbi:hypothetical protein AB1Y20_004226 [Prymnesium parvum]|uniref:DNA-directed DNA polymerase X domain-containing protein n=1 Tax=Prymnesium parvum TaxID=97485 RepID=A0AB34J8S3_PRYPA
MAAAPIDAARDPHIACGSSEMGGRWRTACSFRCCVTSLKPESDDEWVPSPPKPAKRRRSSESSLPPSRDPSDGGDLGVHTLLSRTFPLHHRDDPVHDTIVRQLRQLEKYEIALQGDDFHDKEASAHNHEALSYARASAVVASLPWSLTAARARGREHVVAKLCEEPYVGSFRAQQIWDLLTTGSCEALGAMRDNRAPLGSNGKARLINKAGRVMTGAHGKWVMSRVLGLSALRACNLYDDTGQYGGDKTSLGRPIRSIEELRGLSAAESGLVHGACGGRASFQFGLRIAEELLVPVPPDETERAQAAVREIVWRQARARCGCTRPVELCRDVEERGCRCAWHVELVGGSRRRGKAGHDADLLVWHESEEASWGEGEAGCVLLPLARELEATGRLVRAAEGWQMVSTHHARRQPVRNPQNGKLTRAHRCSPRTSSRGFENLAIDFHDRLFGVWRTQEGRHHRIDIIVCAVPEELPFARLSWTGSRNLNRLMRLQAIKLGLRLTAHGIFADAGKEPSKTVLLHAGVPAQVVQLGCFEEVPYSYVRTEADILRILARGTDDYNALIDPRNRNA